MKKLILTVFVAFATVLALNAQNFGIKAGVNLASITGDLDDIASMDTRTSFNVGVIAEFEISDEFYFQPELLYSGQGAKYKFEESTANYLMEGTLKLDYLNIPLMAKYYLAEGFSLEAGPQIGFLLSANDDWEENDDGVKDSGEDDIKEDFKSVDFSLNVGLGYKLESGLNFGARYNLGLSNINDTEEVDIIDFDMKNGVFQIFLGYNF